MNKSNTCIFSTSNNSEYAKQCILRLNQAQSKMNNCEAYLIGSEFSDSLKVLAKTKKVNLIEVGHKNGYFEREWVYPKECYYWALAPILLREKYAIYIDGDVYCLKNPYLDLRKTSVDSISGITLDNIPGVTNKELKLYKNNFEIDLSIPRINSGVLYMNLPYLKEKSFTEKISSLYKWSYKNNIPRKGDDSLFYIFVKANKYNWGYLPREYNWIYSRFGNPTKDVVWYHCDKK